MADDDAQAHQRAPEPNPALESLDVMAGTWNLKGRESGPDGEIHGQVTFEWMEGGFFLVQRVDIDHIGQKIKGNVAEELAKVKQQPGKDISVVGSATLVRSLLRDDLLDELRLLVQPIVVGRGKRLFPDGADQQPLKLVDSKTFSTGVLYLTYEPALRE